MIRPARITDSQALADIYNQYIASSAVTFEEVVITAKMMGERIQKTSKLFPWLVFEVQGELLGYASATEWKSRSAYRYTAESTAYVKIGHEGKGIGSALYGRLIAELKGSDVHAVVAGITLPNEPSIILHEKMGFEKVAHFKETGYKFGEWRDVGYWELLLK
jgi:L-amino acid N-acyltransferase YncA